MRDRIREILARTASPAGMLNHAMLHTRQDWTGRFRDFAVPVLILHGQDDPILPVENGEALAAGMASSELIVLEGVGHQLAPFEVETIAAMSASRVPHERHLPETVSLPIGLYKITLTSDSGSLSHLCPSMIWHQKNSRPKQRFASANERPDPTEL